MRNINCKSDFKLREVYKGGDDSTPFKFNYFTSARTKYTVSFDGKNYQNCRRIDKSTLLVVFDNHCLSPGMLYVEREFFLTDNDFKDGICNIRSKESTGIYLGTGKTDDCDVTVEVYPNYQKGDKGDPMTYDQMTPEQKEALEASVTENVSMKMVVSEDYDQTEYNDVFTK